MFSLLFRKNTEHHHAFDTVTVCFLYQIQLLSGIVTRKNRWEFSTYKISMPIQINVPLSNRAREKIIWKIIALRWVGI